METKDTSTVHRVALMTSNGAALLFIVQRIYGEPTLDFEVVPRFYTAAAIALLGVASAYLSMLFERIKGAEWLEIVSAFAFGGLMIAWVTAGQGWSVP